MIFRGSLQNHLNLYSTEVKFLGKSVYLYKQEFNFFKSKSKIDLNNIVYNCFNCCLSMKFLKTTLYFSLLIIFPMSTISSENWLKDSISDEVEIDYERTCDSIIEVIRAETRNRLSPNNSYASIEQIYKRKTISISEEKVECTGYALLSNGRERRIEYGAFIDDEGDIIFQTSLDF